MFYVTKHKFMTELKRRITIETLKDLDGLTGALAGRLKGGETIELLGDLGSGKTAFVRSLLSHWPSRDAVASPSFTIENIYRCPDFNVHHFDFYRLAEPGVCAFELSEAVADPRALVIVEWSQIVEDLLPRQCLAIEIRPQPTAERPERRVFNIRHPAEWKYLFETE